LNLTDTYTIAANTNRLTSLATNAGTFTYTHDGRGNQLVEQWPDGSVITVAYDGFARLTRYKVGLATQTMLYNGDDERIRVVTGPTVRPADTRIYMYDRTACSLRYDRPRLRFGKTGWLT
jgi:hypothetical protein